MDEYISREAVKEMFKGIPSLGATANMMVDCIPAADVVKVVRCENCQHSDLINCERWCTLHDVRMNDNDFCSYGTRKEDDGGETNG